MSVPSASTIRELCLQAAERALPVRDALPLLEVLGCIWQQAVESEVVVGLWDGDHLHGLRQIDDQQSASFRTLLLDWDEAALLQHLGTQGVAGTRSEIGSPAVLLAFAIGGEPLGGVAILTSQQFAESLQPLVEMSSKLVAQWRAFDRDLRDRKLEALAEFAAGAGHEINNPLATIAGRATLLLRTETDPERRRSLETIGGQAYRVRDMIGDAMTFARPSAPHRISLNVLSELNTVLASFKPRFDLMGVECVVEIDESLMLTADREQFRVFVSCLLRNELEALSDGGQFSIRVERTRLGERDVVRLRLRDSGPALSPIDREHLFDPFYSGRPAGRGLGFGLSKCWRIVRLHGGTIAAGGDAESGFWLTADWPTGTAEATHPQSGAR